MSNSERGFESYHFRIFLVRFDNFPQIAKNVVLKVIIEKLVIVYYNFIIKMVIVITIVLKISKFYVQIVMQ